LTGRLSAKNDCFGTGRVDYFYLQPESTSVKMVDSWSFDLAQTGRVAIEEMSLRKINE
jgi:hypothetical protein